jgi:hypothetical protein
MTGARDQDGLHEKEYLTKQSHERGYELDCKPPMKCHFIVEGNKFAFSVNSCA